MLEEQHAGFDLAVEHSTGQPGTGGAVARGRSLWHDVAAMRPRHWVFVLTVTGLVVTGAGALAQARADPVVVRQGLQYKPHALALSGDGDFTVHGLRWDSWGGKRALAYGQAVEQERPSHVNYLYPVRVTLSRRTYCPRLHRTVYLLMTARILGPSPGVFGRRTMGELYNCAGYWQLT